MIEFRWVMIMASELLTRFPIHLGPHLAILWVLCWLLFMIV